MLPADFIRTHHSNHRFEGFQNLSGFWDARELTILASQLTTFSEKGHFEIATLVAIQSFKYVLSLLAMSHIKSVDEQCSGVNSWD